MKQHLGAAATWLASFGLLTGASVAAAMGPAGLAAGRLLTLESLLDIRHPSEPAWSPDGTRVAFLWERSGVQNVWMVGAWEGAAQPLTRFEDGLLGSLFWARDGRQVYFEKGGDLWRVAAAGDAAPQPVWRTETAESGFALSPDGARVAFEREGDLWVRSLADGAEARLTETEAAETSPAWSPDGTRLAFGVVLGKARQESPAYSGAKLLFASFAWEGSRAGTVSATGGGPVMVESAAGDFSLPRWVDARRIALEHVAPDLKSREILVADAATGAVTTVHRDVDAKFWSLTFLGAEPLPSPDGRYLAFISDRDGWDQLYVIPTAGGPAVALTRGPQEVSHPAWSPDGRRLAYDTNAGGPPGRRQVAVAELGSEPAKAPGTVVTDGSGTHTLPVWSPDGKALVFQRTGPRDPADLFALALPPAREARPRRLTDSFPASADRDALIAPQFVRYPAPDGQQVPAYLFASSALDRQRRHPAIVWVHGDGITQNYEGWHVRRDYAVYYSVHQYLAQKGYVVLAVDYRGSIGYGRDWRQGHYRDLGGKDYLDIAAGVDYLKTLGYVDVDRVGVWGLSYGGFMALQALTVTPELFRCAINVAGVEDWRDWFHDPNGPWIKGRMGTPEENPLLYTETSPVHRLDRIRRPLLVMHGTADVNVPFLESVRLVDELLKKDRDLDFVMYPGEFHYFQRAHVLRDAWRRVERFFDRHLRDRR